MRTAGGKTIGEAVVALTADDKQMRSAIRGVTGDFNKMAADVARVGVKMAAAGVAITTPFAAAIKSLTTFSGQILKVADTTGLTALEVQKLGYAADQSGASIDDITGAVKRMQRVLTGAEEDSKSAQKAIMRLGLNLGTLKRMSPAEQFQTIARAIANIDDPAKRTTAAMEIFGKSGANLIPTLREMDQSLAKFGTLNIAVDEKTLRAAEELGDTWDDISAQVKSVGYSLAEAVLPEVKALAEWIREVVPEIREWVKENKALAAGLAKTGAALAVIGSGLGVAASTAGKLRSLGLIGGGAALGNGGKAFGLAKNVVKFGARNAPVLTAGTALLAARAETWGRAWEVRKELNRRERARMTDGGTLEQQLPKAGQSTLGMVRQQAVAEELARKQRNMRAGAEFYDRAVGRLRSLPSQAVSPIQRFLEKKLGKWGDNMDFRHMDQRIVESPIGRYLAGLAVPHFSKTAKHHARDPLAPVNASYGTFSNEIERMFVGGGNLKTIAESSQQTANHTKIIKDRLGPTGVNKPVLAWGR